MLLGRKIQNVKTKEKGTAMRIVKRNNVKYIVVQLDINKERAEFPVPIEWKEKDIVILA